MTARLTRRQVLLRAVAIGSGAAFPFGALTQPAAAKSNNFPWGFCTWHAAERFNAVAPEPGVNWGGHARDWFVNAMRAGWRVSGDLFSPRIGAIVVWTGGLGHVAVVEAVRTKRIRTGDVPTAVVLSEMNYGNPRPGFVDPKSPNYGKTENFGKVTRTDALELPRLQPRGSLYFRGYIYPSR